jgi:hypothetical protein
LCSRVFWNTWKRKEKYSIMCDGCLDCIEVLSYWKKSWLWEVIGGKAQRDAKKHMKFWGDKKWSAMELKKRRLCKVRSAQLGWHPLSCNPPDLLVPSSWLHIPKVLLLLALTSFFSPLYCCLALAVACSTTREASSYMATFANLASSY